MNCINLNGWRFNIDNVTTKQYYDQRPVVFENAQIFSDELLSFVDQMGVDIRKPIEYSSDRYEAVFGIFGNAESSEGYELDFPSKKGVVSIIIWPRESFVACDIPNFMIGIENYKILI